MCLVAVLLILAAVQGKPDDVRDGAGAAETPVEEVASVEGDKVPDERVQAVMERVRGAADGEVVDSSRTAFLDDIERQSAQASDGTAAVVWQEAKALPATARSVLEAYRDLGGASLVSAGYIDLKGNAWAALIQGADRWVDVVVLSTSDDTASEVRVVRLTGEGDMG